MRRVGFVAFSLLLHLLLVVAMIDFGGAARRTAAPAVYEVSIVGALPSSVHGSGNGTTGRAAGSPGKKFVRHSGAAVRNLGDVGKERAVRKDSAPELKASDIDQPTPDFEIEDDFRFSDSGAGGAERNVGGDAASGSATAEGLWVGRVRTIVWQVWKFPPELSSLDAGINVTYLIRVGRNGDLLEKSLVLSSGNQPFDRSVLLALNKIKRLPVPPVQLLAGRDDCEILMNFTPPKDEE